MDYQYWRGKYYIVKNLPRPAVIEIYNHSYCSVKQCIVDLLGKGYLPASQLPGNAKHSKYIITQSKVLYGNDLEDVLIMTGLQWSEKMKIYFVNGMVDCIWMDLCNYINSSIVWCIYYFLVLWTHLQLWLHNGWKKQKCCLLIKNIKNICTHAMGLDWCKVIESESRWVSDNYLVYCKIVKWLYHPI